jgi:RNA 2',3'-cyclic 3'-phosphodiesterase
MTAAALFLALWPDDATREALAHWQCGWRWPAGAKVVAAERLHLTLHYIGPVADARVEAVARRLSVAVAPFTLRLGHAEVWPGGLAVLCPDDVPTAMFALHQDLADRLRALELPVERRAFKPHVTIARKAGGAQPPPPLSLDLPVREVVLVASQESYRVLCRYGAAASR